VGVPHRDFEPITGPGAPARRAVHQRSGPQLRCVLVLPAQGGLTTLCRAVPYNHANVEPTICLFSVFVNTRREVSRHRPGSLSLHPSGVTPTPAAGRWRRPRRVYFDETAVMVDTFRPGALGEALGLR